MLLQEEMKQMSSPNTVVAKVGWMFGFQWILINGVAWALGFVAGCDIAGPVGGGLVFGVGVALAHWVMLRDRFSWSRGRPLATILVGATFGMLSFGIDARPVLIGLILGAALGTMQWLELRMHFYRAGWWVLAMIGSMSGGMVVGFGVSCGASLLAGFVAGVVAGAITGIALIWLLRKSKE
jgi:hypothetical protein